MIGMNVLTEEEMLQVKGGKCPYTQAYITKHIKKLLKDGKKEAAAEFIQMTYELGCH